MSPQNFVESLWRGVVLQHVACRADTMEPVGVMALYDLSTVHRHGYLRAHSIPGAQVMLESLGLFVDLCFRRFQLRKIYIESGESQFAQFASLVPDVIQIEGQLRSHIQVDGLVEDLVIGAIYHDNWEIAFGQWRRFLTDDPTG